ncbi:MAG: hypothetical protein H0U49_11155, partial [Parachlamydiaceae bacterium]|nr:hypothetical protein [Parachlamydiaceae bacterium]
TNDRMAVGNIAEGETIKPFYWKSGAEIHFLNQGDNKILDGKIMWVNNQNQVAGFFKNMKETPPGVWSSEQGLQIVKNFRSKPVPDGEAELIDLLIAEDGTVYGTYQIKYTDPSKHSPSVAYAWLPYEGGGFKLLDLEGMQITGLNEWHTLVGSLKGQAAICEPGEKPIELCKIIPQQELTDWELLEATSINNWGDLVGYGKYKGDLHIFYAKKDQKFGAAQEKLSIVQP